ncbi:MAG: MFS transporter, partial [Schaedlerella arabinosiphila]|nr:MFS transporter [Schaedlerella arabinosiphila]
MKRNIYLMYAIAFLQGMVFYGPVATLYRQAQGVSVFQITLIESISLILCILLEAAWGIAADKIGYRKTMIFCCILYFLSKLVFWRASGFAGFLAERVMLSVVIAGMSGVDTSILYLSCKGENSQKVFGIYHSLQTAGLLTAAAVFSLLVRENYPLSGLLTV